LGTFYVVRHAKAGSREDWTGDDHLRPLSKKGLDQAERLVSLLEPFAIKAVFSSPYLRCKQTVEPLGRALRLKVQERLELGEGHGLAGLLSVTADPKLDHAVLCTHADILWALVDELVKRRVVNQGEGGFDKASTWMVEMAGQTPLRARYIPAP
jgi:phosphohistidine phosphatase SixA